MPTAQWRAPATAQQRKRTKSKPIKPKKKDTLSGVRKTKPTRSQVGFCYCKAYKSAPFIGSAKMSLRGYCTDSPALSRLFCFSMSLQSAATRRTLQSKAFRNSPAEAGSARLLQPLHELREDDVRAACNCSAPVYQTRHSAGGRFAEKKRESKLTPLILFLPSFCFFLWLFFAEVD